jgi:hypothetical protein
MTTTTIFPPSLDGFSEQDVREEIITPLLHLLGYQRGTAADIIREVHLRYPRVSLGRKNPRRDPPLGGYADYMLEASGVRWTIEAKAPTAPISPDDVEQAYSYANHPEIRAALFCIINGHELRLYQTNHGPDVKPFLTVAYTDLAMSFDQLSNVLGPDALARDFPAITPDLGQPIGPGLRSVVRITSGLVEFVQSDPAMLFFDEITLFITAGGIERDEAGQLVVYIEAHSPFRSVQAFNERLGFNRFEMVCTDRVLSTSIEAPTVFCGDLLVTLSEGEAIPNLLGEGELVLAQNIRIHSATTASGVLTGNRFAGSFSIAYRYTGLPQWPNDLCITVDGQFEIFLG